MTGSRIGRQPNAVKHAISLEVKKHNEENGILSPNPFPFNKGAQVLNTPSQLASKNAGLREVPPPLNRASTASLPIPIVPTVMQNSTIEVKEENLSPDFDLAEVDIMEVGVSIYIDLI